MVPILVRRSGVAAAAVSALVLAGCSGGPSESEEPGTEGASVVIGYGDIDTLDPIQFKANTGYLVLGNIYGTLFTQEYEEVNGYSTGIDSYVPSLAESAEYNEDGSLLTISLKPELTFADGSPLTAEDVEYTLERTLSDAGYTNVFAPYLKIAEPESDISVVDETTIEIETTGISTVLEKFLSFQSFGIVSKTLAEENGTEDWATDYFSSNATESGPYQIQDWTEGTSITLVKNENYTAEDTSGAPETVTIQNMPSTDQSYLALQNGSIDLALGLPPNLVSQAADVEELSVYEADSSDIVYLGMNQTSDKLQDVKVRQAISHLIPYETLRAEVMDGYANSAYGPAPYPMKSSLDTDGTRDAYETDPAAAQQLLTEAGATDLSLTLSILASDTTAVEAATFIQSALAEAGVSVEVDQMTDANYNTALGDGTTELFLGSWYSWGEDPIYQMNFLLKTDVYTNYARYSNTEFDGLLEEAMLVEDDETRNQLSQDAQQIAIDEAPWAFLYTRDQVVVTGDGVGGVTRPDDQFVRFQYLTLE